MHEILRLLGLCFRAGKLVSGDDAVADTVFAGEARLLLLAADAGANITRRAERHAEQKNVPVIRLTDDAQELGWALGRTATSICCITDAGFAAAAAPKGGKRRCAVCADCTAAGAEKAAHRGAPRYEKNAQQDCRQAYCRR